MLGISLASPFTKLETAALCNFSSTDFSPCRKYLPQLSRKASVSWKLCAVDQPEVILLEDDKTSWDQCKNVLSAFNFTVEEADVILQKAFGWRHSPYWGEDRNKEVPRSDSINEMLDYLKSLSLTDDDVHKILKKFPEVLGCDFEKEVKSNVGLLGSQWGIKGKTLCNLLLRNPKVLGYNVDCKGDCMAQCTRCWVRFWKAVLTFFFL